MIIGVVRAELQVLSLSLSQGRKVFVYLWRCGMNLHQILGVKSSPIIGFFSGVIGHLFLVDFITNPRLRKMAFFLI